MSMEWSNRKNCQRCNAFDCDRVISANSRWAPKPVCPVSQQFFMMVGGQSWRVRLVGGPGRLPRRARPHPDDRRWPAGHSVVAHCFFSVLEMMHGSHLDVAGTVATLRARCVTTPRKKRVFLTPLWPHNEPSVEDHELDV